MTKTTDKSLTDRVWDFFASIKLAIVTFALIGLSSIVGTLIEQRAPYEKNIEIITALVGQSSAPAVYRVLEAMGFMDMYHSWWFIGFLIMFCVNLIICSLNRIPPIWRRVKEPQKPLRDAQFKAFPIKREFTVKGKPEKVKEALKTLRFHLQESEDKGEVQYYGQKGRHSRFGVFVTHLSIIVIMVGSLIGIFFGFSGFLNLPEGSSYGMAFARMSIPREDFRERGMIINVYQQSRGDLEFTAGRLGVDVPTLRGRMKKLGIEILDFFVMCEDFDVQFYGNSDMPKEFTSLLSVYEGGRKVQSKWIEVNDPLKYRGYYFYQSSYGMMEESEDYVYKIRSASSAGQAKTLELREGESFTIPGTGITAAITGFSPAISFDQSGRPFTYDDMMNNPAVKLQITDGSNSYTKWVLKRFPNSWYLTDGHMIQLLDIWGSQYTGLQVRKDPGVWIVYLGCAIMSVGLYVAFFMNHRRVWVRVRTEKGNMKVTVAASANKNRESFERKIDSMVATLTEGGK
jgi:cytochrome c biogenesis protein